MQQQHRSHSSAGSLLLARLGLSRELGEEGRRGGIILLSAGFVSVWWVMASLILQLKLCDLGSAAFLINLPLSLKTALSSPVFQKGFTQ